MGPACHSTDWVFHIVSLREHWHLFTAMALNATAEDQDPANHGTKNILKEFIAADLIATAVIAIFGIAGNFLTMRVLRGPNLRQTSTGFYLTCLSAIDIVVLLIGPTAKALSAAVFASERHLRDVHELGCKLLLFGNYSASQISAWILVAVTVDRAIWVLCPFKARQLCTVRRAAVASAAIFLSVCGVNLQVISLGVLSNRTNENLVVCHISDAQIRDAYVTYVDPALVTVGPFLIMLAANLLIVHRLRALRTRRETSLNKLRPYRPPTGACGRNLTKMLLCTNAFYLFSSLPYLLIMLLLKEKRVEILRVPTLANVVFLAQAVSYLLFNLNYAMHFLLYCLVGPIFKAEAFRLLGIKQQQQQQQQQQQIPLTGQQQQQQQQTSRRSVQEGSCPADINPQQSAQPLLSEGLPDPIN